MLSYCYFENDILFTDFIETMTGDTYKEQLDKTLETSSEDMNYFCIKKINRSLN